MSDTPDLMPVSYWILPAVVDLTGYHRAEVSGPDFAGCGAIQYIRADLHEAERARADKAEAERDALAGKLAKARDDALEEAARAVERTPMRFAGQTEVTVRSGIAATICAMK